MYATYIYIYVLHILTYPSNFSYTFENKSTYIYTYIYIYKNSSRRSLAWELDYSCCRGPDPVGDKSGRGTKCRSRPF